MNDIATYRNYALRSSADHRKFLGKRVNVKLAEGVVATGQLLGFATDGEFEIYDEADGSIHYCWPLLSITEAAGPPAKQPTKGSFVEGISSSIEVFSGGTSSILLSATGLVLGKNLTVSVRIMLDQVGKLIQAIKDAAKETEEKVTEER